MRWKEWVSLKENVKQLPLERRLGYLLIFAKKEKQKDIKEEIQKEISLVEQQLQILEDWKKRGLAKAAAMQESQQKPAQEQTTPSATEATREEEQRQAQMKETLETLEEVVGPPLPPVPATESPAAYSPSSGYVPGAEYAPATSYAPNQYSTQDQLAIQLRGEEAASLHHREQEERERRATGSDRAALEAQKFTEYRSGKPDRKKK